MINKHTLFESFALIGLYFAVQVVSYFVLNGLFDMPIGTLLMSTTLLTAVLMMGVVLALAKYRQAFAVYVGTGIGRAKDWAVGFLGLAVFWVVSEGLGKVFDKSPMDFMGEILANADVGLVVFVVVVVAPIYEELLFRGAIFGRLYGKARLPTIKDKPFWQAGAVSAVLFALVHMQYDWFGFGLILLLAFLLAWARAKTGGLALPIALHIVNNAVAMAVYLFGSP